MIAKSNKKTKKIIRILAIETSCDETSASVLEVSGHPESAHWQDEGSQINSSTKSKNDKNIQIKILSNIVSSQIKLHAKYGGVFPELASREHVKNIIPVINEAICSQISNCNSSAGGQIDKLKHCKLNKNFKLKIKNLFNDIDYIAVTAGPGLIGSLLVGVEAAKTLSYVFDKPLIPVHHVAGHIYANFIGESCHPEVKPKDLTKHDQKTTFDLDSSLTLRMTNNNYPKFPLICLVVSGGHTSLIYMKNHFDFEVIGETLDDAAGEAYDKVASMLGLPYPGGPVIDKIASKYESQNNTLFPRPMLNKNNFNFSFSGLKTSVLYYLKKQKKPYSQALIEKVCFEFQEAATDVLVKKALKAAKKYHAHSIIVCGGVSANSRLREKFQSSISAYNTKNSSKTCLYYPSLNLCTDNAAMIGAAAAYQILTKPHTYQNIKADSNLKLE